MSRRDLRSMVGAALPPPGVPTPFPDVELLSGYLRQGSPRGEPLFLSLGETWTEVAPGLARRLAVSPPSSVHGYGLSMYGLQSLQQVLRQYIPRTQGLPSDMRVGERFEVAVACSGTRNAMFDLGRLLLRTLGPEERNPVVLATLPGWDYAGVFSPLGFRMRYVPLRPEHGFHPPQEEVRHLVAAMDASRDERLALVIINAQHNPTAVNWQEGEVRHLIRLALERGAFVLLDDAYHAVHAPGITPTSSLRILLEELQRAGDEQAWRRWLAVRSLGKQFNCNGWGLGALTAHPETLERMVNGLLLERSFLYASPLQHAMAEWLSSPESEEYLVWLRREYAEKRLLVGRLLEEHLGYPPEAYHLGECTSYLLLRVPPAADTRGDRGWQFRQECFWRTGVLLGAGSMATEETLDKAGPTYLRMFLGPPQSLLREAIERLRQAGFRYQGSW